MKNQTKKERVKFRSNSVIKTLPMVPMSAAWTLYPASPLQNTLHSFFLDEWPHGSDLSSLRYHWLWKDFLFLAVWYNCRHWNPFFVITRLAIWILRIWCCTGILNFIRLNHNSFIWQIHTLDSFYKFSCTLSEI